LLGASYLLSGSRRSAAIRTLEQLATDRDQRVALLAQSQLWRTTAVTTPVEEVRRWRTLIHRLDAPLRGGPYFVWGQALAQKGDHDAAAFSLYRAAVLFPGDRPTAAAALLEAGTALEQAGRRIEAAAAYRELVDDYALQHAYADEARRRLAALKSATPRN
jgi:tetratricopeptide (TPR) repeat protein